MVSSKASWFYTHIYSYVSKISGCELFPSDKAFQESARNACIFTMVGDKAMPGVVAPDPDIASQIFEVAGQVKPLAFGTAQFKSAKNKEDAFA